jgi:hypothetical protein
MISESRRSPISFNNGFGDTFKVVFCPKILKFPKHSRHQNAMTYDFSPLAGFINLSVIYMRGFKFIGLMNIIHRD